MPSQSQLMRVILVVQIASTLAMAGILWFVQIVHYPLFARVDPASLPRYEAEHATHTGWVVAPLMCSELASSALLLVPRLRPAVVPAREAILGASLVAILWLATMLVQVPLHTRLAASYDAETIARLVATNWLRTLAWTARAALVLAWLARLLRV